MATLPINPTGAANPNIPGVPTTGGVAPTLPTSTLANPTAHPLAQNPIIPGAAPAGNATPAATPTTPTSTLSPTLPGVTSIGSTLSQVNGSNTLVGDFSDTYGKGTGTALAGVLGNLGTATDSAVSSTNAAINKQAAQSFANIASGDAAAGISPNSSAAALTTGYFDSNLASTVASTDSQMELGEENTLISALQSEGSAHGSDGSTLDSVLSGIGGAASAASLFF